jgi:hypothetical protein
MRVLYFSTMTVSPGSGGGNTVFNLLEPAPAGNEVFYATPRSHPAHWAPFSELQERIRWIERDRPFQLRGASKIPVVRKLNRLLQKSLQESVQQSFISQLLEHIRSGKIDVLLLSPQSQSMLDLAVSVDLLGKTGMPAVLWFMDNYYNDGSAVALVKQLWNQGRRRFVISEAMQEYFAALYGGECEVLNNSIPVPCYSPPAQDHSSRLRIVYAGALHGYYVDTLSTVLKELKGLEVELDIFSHEKLPPEFCSGDHLTYHHRMPIAGNEVLERLRQYDVLLLLSSFRPEHRSIAETSLASKIADYLLAGRCILAFGPAYAENIRYAQRYGFAEVVTSREQLRTSVLALISDPERRRTLGQRAYDFGRIRHNRATNAAKLWDALSQSCDLNLSQTASKGGLCES